MKAQTRREFLEFVSSAPVTLPALGASDGSGKSRNRPNVILILTDDQAYGDLGCYGNTRIHTPNLDRLHGESARFTNFYVQPVCSPTRSCLMTGRYSYRAGLVDTWVGLSMMRSNETTIAQALSRGAGYRTGIFGKWHLGDHYPLRPIDKGFHEAIACAGGGVNQFGNPIDNAYSDPILYHNGEPKQYHGYCTDIFFDGATEFIEACGDHPFFVYIPTNVVHEPLEVPEKYAAPYRAMGLDDSVSKLYGMVTNLDENIGRLLAKLKELSREENTVVMFLTDNGLSPPKRYNLGLRGFKGGVYEGGIKTPCFVRWPGKLHGGRDIDRIAAHIDLFPTILSICGVPVPTGLKLDGTDLLPLLAEKPGAWPDRYLFVQQSRPDQHGWNVPRLCTHCAVRGQRYKIVMSAPGPEAMTQSVGFAETELYDMEQDPGEGNNIAKDHPEMVFEMRRRYEDWYWDVTKGLDPPVRIQLGSRQENPVELTAQDMRGPGAPGAPWNWQAVHQMAKTEPGGYGYYEVDVITSGRYRITLRFGPAESREIPVFKSGMAFLSIGEFTGEKAIQPGAAEITFDLPLTAGPTRLEALLTGQRPDGSAVSPFLIDVRCADF